MQYDHARVKLEKYDVRTESDYINASHIHLRGTERHYIATQGPVAPSFPHFWQVVVQENVSVIVMLTHLHEGGREKCGNYFRPGRYGAVTVTVADGERASAAPTPADANEGGFFSLADQHRSSPRQSPSLERHEVDPASGTSTVRRRLLVQHDDDPPDRPPRPVLHIQYLAWPDFDVPPNVDDVLSLVTEVNGAQEEALARSEKPGPVLAHCSAGVGRTGSELCAELTAC